MTRFKPFQIIKRGWKVLKKEFSSDSQRQDSSSPKTRPQSSVSQPEHENMNTPLDSPNRSKEVRSPNNQFSSLPTETFNSNTVQPIPATLLILYLDAQTNFLAAPQVLHGFKGQTVHFDLKRFKNYYLNNIQGYTSVFTDRYGIVKVHYEHTKAAAVWLLAKDVDDQTLLAKPEFIHGELNEPYSLVAPSFVNYQLLQARGPVTGHFLDQQQTVTYLYRQKLWQEVDDSLQLIQATEFIQCVSAPHGKPLRMTLAKNTFWQVFKTVTTTDEAVWYCLGGDTWVRASEQTRLVDREKYLIQPAAAKQIPENYAVALHTKATINFVPGKKVSLYDLPCGKKQAELADGSPVNLSAQKNLQGMQWYCVADVGWILAEYLTFS